VDARRKSTRDPAGGKNDHSLTESSLLLPASLKEAIQPHDPVFVVREAVSEYARRHAGETRPRSIGALRTSDPALSQKTDELLAGFGA